MNTTPAITVKHNDIEITYDERRNLFCFELRGRQRTAESLAKAREAIDKPVSEKAKPFARFQAWYNGSSWGTGGWRKVEVTSIAECRYGDSKEVWISIPPDETSHSQFRRKQTERNIVRSESVFPCNEKNDALVAQMMDLNAQAQALTDKADKAKQGMKPYVIPKED